MMDVEQLTLDELIAGYTEDTGNNSFTCLICGKTIHCGEMVEVNDRLMVGEFAMKEHLEQEHPKRLDIILNADNKYVTLTDTQRELILLFSSGMTDAEIAKKLQIAASTVRHQRFLFRERAKEAKMYLAIWALAKIDPKEKKRPLTKQQAEAMYDEDYEITMAEAIKIQEGVFHSLEPMKLKTLSPKLKKRIVALKTIIELFVSERQYTEKEVNEILEPVYEDFVTLRRELINYGFMKRTDNGAEYWRL